MDCSSIDQVSHDPSFPRTLIHYTVLCRCHRSFFNDFNFGPMLVACIGRTVLELCVLSTALWPEWTAHWCQAVLFLVLVQLQTISSMLLVFVFQNTLLAVLSSKIYLSKNYATSLHAMTKTRQIQTITAIVFAPVQLALLFSAGQSTLCWPTLPQFSSTGLINVLLILSPFLQLSTVRIERVSFHPSHQLAFSTIGCYRWFCLSSLQPEGILRLRLPEPALHQSANNTL